MFEDSNTRPLTFYVKLTLNPTELAKALAHWALDRLII
jgi:hypothetical protein